MLSPYLVPLLEIWFIFSRVFRTWDKKTVHVIPYILQWKYERFSVFLMHFCPGTITIQAESIDSDLQRGLERRLRHTALNTEQNQLAIKVSADD